MNQKLVFFINGKFSSEDKAKIPVMDLGLLRGYGLFDFLRTYNGKPFLIDYHIKNFINSAEKIGLSLPLREKELRELILLTLRKNQFLKEANIRIILTGGQTSDSVTSLGKPTLLILVTPQTVYPKDYYEKGISVITVKINRTLPEIKSISYLSAVMAVSCAKEKNAQEAIYLDTDNNLLEGTRTNLFFIKDQTLITANKNIYLGTTRKVVLILAKNNLKIEERIVNHKELEEMDECFITSTSKEIMPVVKIGDNIIGNGKVGKKTSQLMNLFKNFVKGGLWKI